MKKSTLKPTIKETFEIGKTQGVLETFEEVLTVMNELKDMKSLYFYIKGRLKSAPRSLPK